MSTHKSLFSNNLQTYSGPACGSEIRTVQAPVRTTRRLRLRRSVRRVWCKRACRHNTRHRRSLLEPVLSSQQFRLPLVERANPANGGGALSVCHAWSEQLDVVVATFRLWCGFETPHPCVKPAGLHSA